MKHRRRIRKAITRSGDWLLSAWQRVLGRVANVTASVYQATLGRLLRAAGQRLSSWYVWQWLARRLADASTALRRWVDWGDAWMRTRRWRYALNGMPAALLALVAFAVVLFETQSPVSGRIIEYRSALSEAIEDGDSKAAYIFLRKLHRLGDRDAETKFKLALFLEQQRRLNSARELMSEIAPTNGAGHAQAHYWLAIDLVNTTDQWRPETNRQLVHHLERYLDRFPENNSARLMLGEAFLRMDKKQDAAAQLEKAAEVMGEVYPLLAETYSKLGEDSRAQGAKLNAQRFFAQQVAKDPKDVEARLQWARFTSETSDYSETAGLFSAARILEQGLTHSSDPRLRETVGALYMRILLTQPDLEDWGDRLKLLEIALFFAPDQIDAMRYLAALLRPPGADSYPLVHVLNAALADGKGAALAHILLAIDARSQERAQTHFQQAQHLNPSVPILLNNLAIVVAKSDPPQLERSLTIADAAVRLAPSDATLLETRARIHLELEHFEEARDDLAAAVEKKNGKGSAALHETLAEVYRQLGESKLAAHHHSRAEELSTQSNAAAEGIGNQHGTP